MANNLNKKRTIFEGEGLWLLLILAIAHCVVFYIVEHYQENLRFCSFDFAKYIRYVVGYGFALLLGMAVVGAFYMREWNTFEEIKRKTQLPISEETKKDFVKPTQALSRYIGILERAAYITAFIYEQYEFVAVWLAVKAAISWKQYYEEGHLGREKWNSYLLNSLLSLGYAFVGWLIIEHCYCIDVIILPIVVVAASYLVWRYLGKDLDDWSED